VDKHDDWVAYQDYREPKQSRFMQVFDVLFILVLCYLFLLVPILLTGKVLVGS
jgi:hypothetical protein